MFIKRNNSSQNKFYMDLALRHAKKGLGNTGVNPSVGCVIIKDNSVIGSGNTGFFGRPHAERLAINNARSKTNSSSIYITLEPCSHFGKTPPCTDKIIKGKFKNVFFSINDPDKRTYKKSKKKIEAKGIKVFQGINKNKISRFYESYIKFKNDSIPMINTKIAVSKDLFLKNKKSKWITNNYARQRGHYLRSQHDSILTTIKTIKDDNPTLNCRINGLETTTPTRFIIDRNLRISLNSKILKSSDKYLTYIFYNKLNKKKIKHLIKKKIKLIHMNLDENDNFDLISIFKKIKIMGYSRTLVESGKEFNTKLLVNNLINYVYFFVSKNKIYNKGLLSMKKFIFSMNKNKISKTNQKINLFGDSFKIYKLK